MSASKKNHEFKRTTTKDGKYVGWCSCGFPTGEQPTRLAREDVEKKHYGDVERIKAHLGKKDPSLEDQAKYYRAMADTTKPGKEKDLWEQLAHGIEERLGLFAPPSEQMQIPF